MDNWMTLVRRHSDENGTFGDLFWNGERICYTLEDPWNDNRKRVSCIPRGIYKAVRHGWKDEPVRFKNVWHIQGVPGRDAILIHAGNTIDDTLGCVLVGTTKGNIEGLPAILGSRSALELLRGILPEKFTIEITGVVG